MSSAQTMEYSNRTSKSKPCLNVKNETTEREVLKITKALPVKAFISVFRFWTKFLVVFRFSAIFRAGFRILVGPYVPSIFVITESSCSRGVGVGVLPTVLTARLFWVNKQAWRNLIYFSCLFFIIARRRQNLSDARLKTCAVHCVFISGHSGVPVNERGNIDRFRAMVQLS